MAECLGDQVPVADHHPLGRPRGAGGEGEDGWVGGRVERWRGEGWRGGEEGVEGEMAAHSFAICWSVGVVFEIPIALRGFEMSWCENIFFALVIKI